MKNIAKGVAGQLGRLTLDTAVKAVAEPLGLEKLTGSTSSAASKPNISQLIKTDQAQSGAEIEALRKQLNQTNQVSQGGGVRDLEKEIQQVRAKKEQLFEQKERELKKEKEKKREEEEELVQQDALPVSSRPKRGSALVKGKKGTQETDLRRSV